MRAVSPNTGAPEVVVAEDQEEYLPLSVAFYAHEDGTRSLVTAWVPTTEELDVLAKDLLERLGKTPLVLSHGHARTLLSGLFKANPILVRQLNFGRGMTPMNVYVGAPEWMVVADAAEPTPPTTQPDATGYEGEDGG